MVSSCVSSILSLFFCESFYSPNPEEIHHIMKPWTAVFCAVGVMFALESCAGFKLENVDFGWPVESVVSVSPNNRIEDVRYAVTANVAPIALAEFQDSTALRGAKLRIIRSSEGFYFVTGPKFKNVYVLAPDASTLSLYSTIAILEAGMRDPALNQRPPYVELVDGQNFHRLLSNSDIVEVKK
jgi:hypothetical protein